MKSSLLHSPITRFIFFGNHFYGACAVLLSLEASIQQNIPYDHWSFYLILYCSTTYFYTLAYINDTSGYPSNERDKWYEAHRKLIQTGQYLLMGGMIFGSGVWLFKFNHALQQLSMAHLGVALLFPLLSFLYYGIGPSVNIRRFGYLKPFIIGICWAGVVTLYPELFSSLENSYPFEITILGFILFLENVLFISVLCLMFDIKDYAHDSRNQLNTIVVGRGLRVTIFHIILPLAMLGISGFVFYAIAHHFHPIKILLNVIPFALMIYAAYTLKERKNIMYYLINVDGLMLMKAICGFVAMKYF